MARLKQDFNEKIRPELQRKLGLKSIMAVPKIKAITINMGVGEAVTDKKALDNAIEDLAKISGQKPIKTIARRSVAGFKIRKGWPIGCKVTLRGDRMYEFLDRLVNVAIPRIRDFRGLKTKFDGRGNYNLGIREQIIFPEIDFEKLDSIRGMDINITTTSMDDESAKLLFKSFNFPLKDK